MANIYFAVILACLSLGCSSSGELEPQTTLDPEEIRPVNFYMNKNSEVNVTKTVICSGWPCPGFSVVEDQSPLVQERLYSPMDIVVAYANGCQPFEAALMEGYMKLYSYRHGNNNKGQKVTMSVPVIVKITNDESKVCGKAFEVWFYVDSSSPQLANGIPEPLENSESMEVRKNIPAMDLYVGTFRGKIVDPQPELNTLKTNLLSGVTYDPKVYFVAMYDRPEKAKGRRNEIWLKKQ